MLLEKVRGQSLGDFLQEHVFTPLKLNSTSLPTDSVVPDPHAHGYSSFTPMRLLSMKTQAERLRTLPTGFPEISYGLGILNTNGWLGHNGEIPGYESIAAQLPAEKASLVVLVTSDVDYNGKNLSSLVGNAVTSIVTPDHLWPAPVPTAPE